MEGGGGIDSPPPSSAIVGGDTLEEENRETKYDADQAKALAKADAELDAACPPAYEGEGLPPELEAVPRAELGEAYRVVKAWAAKEAKSKPLAAELIQIVYLTPAAERRRAPAPQAGPIRPRSFSKKCAAR